MSISSFFGNIATKTGDFLGFDGQLGYQGVTNTVPVPARKPAYTNTGMQTTSPGIAGNVIYNTAPQSGFSLGGIGDFLNKAASTVKEGFNTYFSTKSQIELAKTAQEIEEIKLQAIRQSAQQAPAAAQVILPTFSDFINDPREAASRVTPAAIAGSGAIQSGMNILTLGAIGVAIFLAARG